jgi:hypothetical protein
MSTSYPIVAQYELGDPVKRGRLGLGKRRDTEEIPKIKPHEVLVYRVGSKFVVDERRLRTYDEMVVHASSVSVVSVRRGTEVTVSFQIDSKDGLKFTVKVTFVCSVVDPVIVVRDGQVDASDVLLAYLKGYQDLFDLGLKHPISEINDLRSEAAFQVKAYMALRPPAIPGMEIALANVQVETPTVLADLGQLANEQLIQLQKVQAEELLEARRQSHILDKTAKLGEAVGDDPKRALDMAHADGGLSSQEYAERVQQLDEARQQREQAERLAAETREFTVQDRDAQWAHDDGRTESDWQRSQRELERQEAIQRRREELEADIKLRERRVALEDRDSQWAREERKAEAEWQHSQLETGRTETIQRRREELEANIKLLQMLAERGHLDTHYEDIGDLIRRIRGEVSTGRDESAEEQAALPQGGERESANEKDDNGN